MKSPKISKGENYKGLPYVILDYPRCFEKENTLAIRTMFWWGNFFSVSLQLSGQCRDIFLPVLIDHFSILQQGDYWLCISHDPWQHHFEANNYIPISSCTEPDFSTILYRESFIKIAKKMPVQQWDKAPAFLEQSFEEMIRLLKT